MEQYCTICSQGTGGMKKQKPMPTTDRLLERKTYYRLPFNHTELFEMLEEARVEERNKIKQNIGLLRQWLNEKPIGLMMTNKMIEEWLFLPTQDTLEQEIENTRERFKSNPESFPTMTDEEFINPTQDTQEDV